jgi:hypothetical protein
MYIFRLGPRGLVIPGLVISGFSRSFFLSWLTMTFLSDCDAWRTIYMSQLKTLDCNQFRHKLWHIIFVYQNFFHNFPWNYKMLICDWLYLWSGDYSIIMGSYWTFESDLSNLFFVDSYQKVTQSFSSFCCFHNILKNIWAFVTKSFCHDNNINH